MIPEGKNGILICNGTSCNIAGRSMKLFREIRRQLREHDVLPQWDIQLCGCMGFCQNAPMICTTPEGTPYHKIQMSDVAELVESHCVRGEILERKKLTFHAPH